MQQQLLLVFSATDQLHACASFSYTLGSDPATRSGLHPHKLSGANCGLSSPRLCRRVGERGTRGNV